MPRLVVSEAASSSRRRALVLGARDPAAGDVVDRGRAGSAPAGSASPTRRRRTTRRRSGRRAAAASSARRPHQPTSTHGQEAEQEDVAVEEHPARPQRSAPSECATMYVSIAAHVGAVDVRRVRPVAARCRPTCGCPAQSTKTNRKRLWSLRDFSSVARRPGEAVLLERGEHARVDRVEHDHRHLAAPVHERERPLEVGEAVRLVEVRARLGERLVVRTDGCDELRDRLPQRRRVLGQVAGATGSSATRRRGSGCASGRCASTHFSNTRQDAFVASVLRYVRRRRVRGRRRPADTGARGDRAPAAAGRRRPRGRRR